ncbi:VRR-NUC domain-containing protein [Anaerosinus sp.]
MLEHDIQNKIRVHVSQNKLATLFRANVGNAWTGNNVEHKNYGSVLIHDARPFTTGLPQGFPDLFGLKSIEVTPDMVGKKIAAFVFIEVKQPKKKPTKTQTHMHEFLTAQGAIGGVAHSAEEAEKLLNYE